VTRHQTARTLASVASVGFFLEAGLHTYQYRQVVLQAQAQLSGLLPLVSALWLAFAAAMLVLGGMVTVVALGRVTGARWILALAGCLPLVTVLLQLRFLGFTRATATLATHHESELGRQLARRRVVTLLNVGRNAFGVGPIPEVANRGVHRLAADPLIAPFLGDPPTRFDLVRGDPLDAIPGKAQLCAAEETLVS